MIRKSIYALLAAASMGICATSCSNELDIPQKGSYPTDTYYSTDEEAATALALSMSYINNMAFEIIQSINCLSDDVWPGGANAGDQPGLHQFSGFYISTENDKVLNIYSFCYRLIYFSNVLIEKLENKDDATPFMKQCVAEAYFLRGWAEFYLGVFWGNPPIVDHVLQPNEYNSVTNSEYGEMLEQAGKDFRHAIESGNLPEKNALGDKTNLAHCTLAAAQGYLGKVYLFQQKYTEAASTLDKIIDSKKYKLYDGDYADIIKAPSNWSDEGIFEINCPPGQTDATAPQLMSYVYIYAGWREDHFDFTGISPDFGNFNTTGYGFFNPQDALAEALIKSDGADGYRTTSVVKDQAFVQNVMGIAKKPNSPAHGHGLYCGWKNRYEWSDVSMNWGGWSPFPATNFRYMRYAEVLLSAAEAHFQSGNTTKALEYVNEVRTRAQAPLYSSIDMDKIKLERQVELCMEGQRFMDLVRWGDAEAVLGKQGQNIEKLDIDASGKWILVPDDSSSPSYGFKAGRNELLPYPQREMDQNANIKQNPGY
ncbi:MAG: RagB/SusD family nutrient uptake outer membrane protein [Muribaculaceae bacterium]|nr:RagB/SusD family nutrient uptake outer membrane protein [Muribaculaceae bacterium]